MKIEYKSTSEQFSLAFHGSSDVVRLDIKVANMDAAIFFLDGFIDKKLFEDNILEKLKRIKKLVPPYENTLMESTLVSTAIKTVDDQSEAIDCVADGDIVLLIDTADNYFVFSEKEYKIRSIETPPVSTVLRGPREGFVEDLKTNMTMVRRRLKTRDLVFDTLTIGKYTRTKVCVLSIQGIADEKIKKIVLDKLSAINIDGVLESRYVSRYLEESPNGMFTQVGTCEKPDVLTGKLLEGRICILVDGSPTAISVPFILLEHFQTSEDYYISNVRATMLRCVRLIAIFIAVLLPALYVSLQEFHYQMTPFKLLMSIMNSTSSIPLTPTLEMLAVIFIFEILSEASIRMPRYIGMALSVVGAIILGETAVNAALISPPAILIVSISALGLYCVPDESHTTSMLRLLFVVVAGVIGLFGIIISCCVLGAYLCSLKAYGASYLSPYAPISVHDWQDGFTKLSVSEIKERPVSIPTQNSTRNATDDNVIAEISMENDS